VLANREYLAVFTGSALAWFGDNAARAAVTALVFDQTRSVAASGPTFAISFLPWLGIGPVLAAMAERYEYRRVMIFCDMVRMVLMGLIAMPNMPVAALIALLFATALLNPPFEATR
jgi:MFS family permease